MWKTRPRRVAAGRRAFVAGPRAISRRRADPRRGSLASRCVAAYLVHVGALLRRIAASVSRLASLWLPLMSRMAQRTPRSATDPTFDNVVWVRDEPAPAYVRITLLRPHGREAEALKAKA